MVTDESVERWKRIENSNSSDPLKAEWFPIYFVAQPPHTDGLSAVYYKIVSPSGPIFWRQEGDDTGRSTSFYDLLMEEMNGTGINKVQKRYTPWGEN